MRKAILFGLAGAAFAVAAAFAQAPSSGSGSTISGEAINRSTVNVPVVITTGATFQTILASNFGTLTPRQSLTIENNNASDNCWLYIGAGTPTKALSMLLKTGGSYTRYWPFVPSDAIQATCDNTNDTMYLDYQ
jgi:hypothetical protein